MKVADFLNFIEVTEAYAKCKINIENDTDDDIPIWEGDLSNIPYKFANDELSEKDKVFFGYEEWYNKDVNKINFFPTVYIYIKED